MCRQIFLLVARDSTEAAVGMRGQALCLVRFGREINKKNRLRGRHCAQLHKHFVGFAGEIAQVSTRGCKREKPLTCRFLKASAPRQYFFDSWQPCKERVIGLCRNASPSLHSWLDQTFWHTPPPRFRKKGPSRTPLPPFCSIKKFRLRTPPPALAALAIDVTEEEEKGGREGRFPARLS